MKKQFMQSLKETLKPLTKNERDEILAFYEERFETGKQEGLSEQDIIDTLESPKTIAANVLPELGGSTPPPPAFNWVSLIFLNLFFTSWFLPLMAALSFGFVFPGLYSFSEAAVRLGSIPSSGLMFYALVQMGVSVILVMLGLVAFEGLMRFIAWLLAVHFQAFGSEVPSSLTKMVHHLTPSTWLSLRPSLQKIQRFILASGLILAFIGSVGTFVLRADLQAETLVDFNASEAVLEDFSIALDLDDGRVFIERHEGSEILLEGRFRSDQTFEYDFSNGLFTASLSSPRFRVNMTVPWVVTDRPFLRIKVPQSVSLDQLKVDSSNGLVSISNLQGDTFEVKTSNGSITLVDTSVTHSIQLVSSNATLTLNRVNGETLDLKTSNGRIIVRDTHALTHRYETSNGAVELNDINRPEAPGSTLSVQSSNGSLNLNNVYVSEVRLRTSNGSIHYDNTDRSFFLDVVEAHTSNGTTNVNVPRN